MATKNNEIKFKNNLKALSKKEKQLVESHKINSFSEFEREIMKGNGN